MAKQHIYCLAFAMFSHMATLGAQFSANENGARIIDDENMCSAEIHHVPTKDEYEDQMTDNYCYPPTNT